MSELDALTALGLPERIAAGARAALGADAASMVASDPWSLLAVNGVRPEQVDAYARARLGPQARPEDTRRQAALLAWLLQRAALDGHTVLPLAIAGSALAAYGIEKPDPAITECTDRGLVVSTDEGLALRLYAEAEHQLAAVLSTPAVMRSATLAPSPEWVKRVLADKVTIVAGQPGERLDDAVRALTKGARDRALPLSLVAPTAGSAASLAALVDAAVQVDAQVAATPPGLLLVADVHAFDVVRLARLSQSASQDTIVVLVGDLHALPPLDGPGQPFADLAASGSVAVYDTEPEHHEAEQVATIADLATSVARGALPRIDAADRQVVLVPAATAEQAASHAARLVTDSIPRAFGIAAADVMVLGPAIRGVAGVRALNATLKAATNPGAGGVHGFDPGDRVVLTGEIGDPAVRAGDYGTVVADVGGSLQVDMHGREVLVTPPLRGRVRHARAMTVARAAVGRWPACVLVLPAESAGVLSRALIRTAITRAERQLSIVHAAGPAVAHAVGYGRERRRRTLLPALIRRVPPKV